MPSLTSLLFRAARMSADGRAIRRGRVPQRAVNKVIGRNAGKILRRLYR
jgi:hypothetical protein